MSFGQSPFAFQTVSTTEADDAAKIRRSVDEISKAYVSRDPEPFERLFLTNHAGIRERPVFNLREQLIAMMRADSLLLRAGRKLDFETIFYENELPQITLYGPAAVVSVAKKNQWRYRGQNCSTRTQATELWIRRDDGWKIAVGHNTTFPCDPRPYHPIHPAVADIPSSSRAPVNSDRKAERDIRELIDLFVRARVATDNSLSTLIESHVAAGFVSTNIDGEIGRDTSILREVQAYAPSRPLGLRNQDDAIVVYDHAAIYTFRKRPSSPGELPIQVTIMFAEIDSKWMIVASHATSF